MKSGISREVYKSPIWVEPLCCSKLKIKVEVDLVLLRGSRCLKKREFFLQKWGLEVGCFRNGSHPKEVWVKVVGLPLHLWSREVFKSIGERCGVS